MIVLDIGNPFFTDLARGAEDRARRSGLSLLLADARQIGDRETSYIDLFEEQRVRGVLITPVDDAIPRLVRLRRHGIPSVLVDRIAPPSGFSSVSVDDVAGGRLAMEHLMATGRRRVLFVGGPLDLRQVRDRLTGARDAVAAHPGAVLDVLEIDALTIGEGVAVGRALAARPDRPDAVFAANDLVAIGVFQGLVVLGDVRVPDDVAIVGYDDIDFAAAAAVPITSVRQPRERMGSEAVDLLALELDGDQVRRRIVFQPELIVRESTRPRSREDARSIDACQPVPVSRAGAPV
jgi:LacI family transcriptional regulator